MNRPIVFYSISVALGCISSLLFVNSLFLGAVFAASFLLVIFFTIEKKYFILCGAFFVMGIAAFCIYFYGTEPDNEAVIRIMQKKEFYSIGEYKNRRVMLKGSVCKVEEGVKVIAAGEFTKEKDYERGIIGTYTVKEYKCLKKDLISSLYTFKRNTYKRLKTVFGDKNAALVASLCYGDTTELSQKQKDDFNKLGVIHAVSVSGFHMAIIYKLLEVVLGLELALVICFIYTLFTGLQASTLRAFIMILVLKLSKKVRKNYDKLSSLGFAAMILMVLKPYYIADLGFLLTFLSTLGIVLYYDKIKKMVYRLPLKVGEAVSVTLSAQILSMPLVAMSLNNFSTGFFLGNLILLPFYSVVVVLGNAAMLTVWYSPLFNSFCFFIKIVLIAIEGADYLLLKVCPPIVYFNFWEGVVLALIVLSYMLVKAGYKSFRFLPVFLFLTVIVQNYSFIPEIKYTSIKGQQCVILKYRNESLLFCIKKPQMNSCELKQRYRVEKIIENANNGCKADLGDGSFVAAKGNYKDINIELFIKGKRYVFLKDSISKNLDNVYKYDIIRVSNKKYSGTSVYDIVLGRVYTISYN